MTEKKALTRDRIILSDLGFYGYHGMLPQEKTLGQRFRIDLECGLDLRESGRSDEVKDTVSYADIAAVALEVATNQRFDLIEALAQTICDTLFSNFASIEWIEIKIHKPNAPVPVPMGEFAIQIYRERAVN